MLQNTTVVNATSLLVLKKNKGSGQLKQAQVELYSFLRLK